MAEVRTLKDRYGSTINDVVLAVCSGALRTHLALHDQDTDSPLVAVVPVSVRAEGGEAAGNQLSAMFVPLANDRLTPLERLRTVTASSASCKGQERAVGFGPLATLMAEAIPPALAKPVIQLGVRSGVLRKLRAGNLMISNVPGPDFPLYFAGMELRAVHPLGPVIDGVALNVTVQSYRDALFVGINACATAVPDLPGLARAMGTSWACWAGWRPGRGSGGPRPRARHRRTAPAHDTGGDDAAEPGGARRPGCARVAGCSGRTSRVARSQVAPRLLNKILVRGEPVGAHRRGRGVPRGQRRGLPRLPGTDAAHGGHVRPRRASSTCTSPTGCTGAPTWSAAPRGRQRRS